MQNLSQEAEHHSLSRTGIYSHLLNEWLLPLELLSLLFFGWITSALDLLVLTQVYTVVRILMHEWFGQQPQNVLFLLRIIIALHS